jgi:hypothetical protein
MTETPAERRKRLARERQRRRRDRIKRGKRLILVEVDDLDACETLASSGDLDPMLDDDNLAVRAALERALRRWFDDHA